LSKPNRPEIYHPRFYDRHIPSFAEAALDQRYGSLFSSIPQLGLYSLQDISTYVEWKESIIQELFLYRRDKNHITVINQGMQVDGAAVQRFADAIFQHEPGTNRLCFHSVDLIKHHQLQKKIFLPISEDSVIDLPNTESDYLATLGRSLRQSMQSRLKRTQGLKHKTFPGSAVDTQLLERIIAFNHARMLAKQRYSAIDEAETKRLLTLAHARGVVGTIEINDKLCAGSLVCRFGDDIFSLLNAHDPSMNKLGLGKLSRHLMILEAIRSGARRFHLLGGYFNSKRPFGARRIPLCTLLVYRGRLGMVKDTASLLRLLLQSLDYRLRAFIEDHKSEATNRLQRSLSISKVSVLPRHQRSVRGLWRE